MGKVLRGVAGDDAHQVIRREKVWMVRGGGTDRRHRWEAVVFRVQVQVWTVLLEGVPKRRLAPPQSEVQDRATPL